MAYCLGYYTSIEYRMSQASTDRSDGGGRASDASSAKATEQMKSALLQAASVKRQFLQTLRRHSSGSEEGNNSPV
jgi:hypothetical protein